HGKEQVNVRLDFRGDVDLAGIGGLKLFDLVDALGSDDLVPGWQVFHPDDYDLPPVGRAIFDDVAVGRQRDVGGARAEEAREVHGRGVIDAVPGDRAVQRPGGSREPQGDDHVELRDWAGAGIGSVGADLAAAGGADRKPIVGGRAAEERLLIEEAD